MAGPYSDAFKAAAIMRLAATGYNYKAVAEEMDVSIKSLRRWDKEAPKKTVGELLEHAIRQLLQSIPDDMSGNEWGVAIGILFDKLFLMQGDPTVRTESIVHGYRDLTDEEKEIVSERAREIIAEFSENGDRPRSPDGADSSSETT